MRTGSAEKRYWVWLSSIAAIPARTFYALIAQYGCAAAVYHEKTFAQASFLSAAQRSALRRAQNEGQIDQLKEQLHSLHAVAITRLEDAYPPLLREIYDPPPTLFVRGKRNMQQQRAIAIVGARNCTRQGAQAAIQIAHGLAQAGVCVVSGLARGIDAAAHQGALQGGGNTAAILGCGPEMAYPPENQPLFDEILQQGQIISEYPPGTPPRKMHFPARNRIISGMCHGTVLVEASGRSGANITVELALSEGREVFAVPGNVLQPQSDGPNQLLKNGAALATCAQDVLQTMGWESPEPLALPGLEAVLLNPVEARVARCLLAGESDHDELLEHSGCETAELNMVLTMLELRGIMKQLPGNRYQIAPGFEKTVAASI